MKLTVYPIKAHRFSIRRQILAGDKGVAATVGSVGVQLLTVDADNGVFQAAMLQDMVEFPAVFFDGHPGAVSATEDGACDLSGGETVDDGLDLGADGDGLILACGGFDTDDEGFLFAVIVGGVQIQQFRRSEAKIALSHNIVAVGDLANVVSEDFQIGGGETGFSDASCAANSEVLTHVQSGIVSGNGVLIEHTAEGLHILLGAAAFHIVHAVLEIVHGNLRHGDIPEGEEVLEGGGVAAHGFV